jgi:exosome complex component RRP43
MQKKRFDLNLYLIHRDILIADPNAEEENLSSTIITVAVCESELCYVHKPGGCPLSPEQIEKCLSETIAREKCVVKLIDGVLKS